MRIAILSDIHANLRAWNAVLADIASTKADRLLCLGDIVGYGPSPVEVLESAYRHVHGFVLGNHDAVVAGKMSPDVFNDRARRLILWTRDRIGPRGVKFLGQLPLVLNGNGMRCAHANFVRPSAFDYILEPEDADASWHATSEPLLFVGHTHVPQLFVIGSSGTPHRLDPQDFQMEPGKRYIVNVGAVGLPRDADGRACYVLYDDVARTVCFRRVPFDMDAFRDDVARAGLDPADVPLLAADPRRHLASLREEPDFAPPRRVEDEARNVVAEQAVETSLRRKAARWRTAAIGAAIAATILAAGAVAIFLSRDEPHPLDLPSDLTPRKLAYAATFSNVLPPLPAGLDRDGGMGDWGVRLDDSRHQSLQTFAGPGPGGEERPMLRIENDGRLSLRIESPDFLVPESGPPPLAIGAFARQGEGFSGSYLLILELRDDHGKLFKELRVGFNQMQGKKAEWFRAQQSWAKSKTLPRKTASLRFVFDGDFSGTLDLCDPALELR